jgi:hypothetical protein
MVSLNANESRETCTEHSDRSIRERLEAIVSVTTETTRDYAAATTRSTTVGGPVIELTAVKVALGVGMVGSVVAFLGLIAFLLRFKFAEFFLGAHLWFNVPVTDADAVKVLFMAFQAAQAMAWGAVTAGVAFLFAFVRWTQSQAEGRTPAL